MEDISQHIMDVAENSLQAGAKSVSISIRENPAEKMLVVSVVDDGKGMDVFDLDKATDPFYTTKQGKKVGLGLSLFAQSAEETGGRVTVQSAGHNGVKVTAVFHPDHPDMKPVGDLPSAVRSLIKANPSVHITCVCVSRDLRFSLDSNDP